MPFFPWLLIFLALLGAENSALAALGTKDGGGGKGVLCGSKLRTLDIYEAEEVHHFAPGKRYPDAPANFFAYGTRVIQELFPLKMNELVLGFFVESMQAETEKRLQPIPSGERLALSEDATLPRLPTGCAIVQIALIDDKEDLIHLDPEYWGMLDGYNQAALLLHEGVYRYLRETGRVATSDETRSLIGTLMSAQPHTPIFQPVWQAPRLLWCRTNEATIGRTFDILGIEERGGLTLYFYSFNGVIVLSPTRAFLPGASLDGLQATPSGQFRLPVKKDFPSPATEVDLRLSPRPEAGIPDGFGDFDFAFQIRALGGQGEAALTPGYCKVMHHGELKL